MFIFRRRRAVSPSKPFESSAHKHDDLNRSATSMAEDLIRGQGGESYRQGTKALFRAVPSLIQDVAPEYRSALEEELQHTDT